MADCLADVSTALVSALVALGADVHVALPNYRRLFNGNIFHLHEGELKKYHEGLPDARIHLAQDRIVYYRDHIYSGYHNEAMRITLVFQREVINHIIPVVNPDLIHCNNWMTGLIPAMAKRRGIKSLLTVHDIHTRDVLLQTIEENGIDAAEFWLNFTAVPQSEHDAPWALNLRGLESVLAEWRLRLFLREVDIIRYLRGDAVP